MSDVKTVATNQEGIFKDLEITVKKYAITEYLRPIAEHTRLAYTKIKEEIFAFYKEGTKPFPIVLDSGCGTGESTIHLAKKFPKYFVLGIDKSQVRLNKTGLSKEHGEIPANAFYTRGELLDFWRLLLDDVKSGIFEVVFHAIFYPNPWPKQSEANRRFHLHPIFKTIIALSERIELRTNWEIYAREFAKAAELYHKELNCETFVPEPPLSAFERKYFLAGQTLWKVY